MLFVVLFMTALVFYLWNKRNAQSSLEPPLLPGALPLIGHSYLLFGSGKNYWEMIKRESKKAMSFADAITFLVFSHKKYVLLDPDDCLTVANAFVEKDTVYNAGRSCFGVGLVTASIDTWKEHRKLLNPEFNLNYLLSLLVVFNKQSRILSQEFESYIDKGEFDHGSIIRHNEMKTICLTSIGLDLSDNKDMMVEYKNAFDTILQSFVEQLLSWWLYITFFWKRSSLRVKRFASRNVMHGIIDTIIKRKKVDYDNSLITRNYDEGENFKPFLDVLFDVKKTVGDEVMTDKFVRDHVNTLIFAGHDTVAITLQLSLIMIGSYPAVQDRLYAELQEVFGSSDRDVEKDDLTKLIYLEAVLKETMRLYPVVPILGRYLHHDVKLKNFTLEGQNSCFLNVYAVNRHPMWGRDAGHFRPERWLNPNTLPSNPNAFTTFSLGKRNCIGRTYSMVSMKTTVAHLLRRYRICADDKKLHITFEMMLRPVSGHYISIEKR